MEIQELNLYVMEKIVLIRPLEEEIEKTEQHIKKNLFVKWGQVGCGKYREENIIDKDNIYQYKCKKSALKKIKRSL